MNEFNLTGNVTQQQQQHHNGIGTSAAVNSSSNSSGGVSPLISFDGHVGNVLSLGFQRDGFWIYSSGEDGNIKIWDLRTPICQRSYNCKAAVNSVTLHPNQAELYSGDQAGFVKHWDLTTNKCVSEMTPEGDVAIRSVCVSHDLSMVIAANQESNVFVWQPNLDVGPNDNQNGYQHQFGGNTTEDQSYENGKGTSSSKDTKDPYNKRASLNSGNGFENTGTGQQQPNNASSNPILNNVYNMKNFAKSKSLYTPLYQWKAHQNRLLKCVLSPDGKKVVTCSDDKTARVWSTETWEEEHTLRYHNKWVWDACFSADSSYLLTASSDAHARLWDLSSGELLRQYSGHQLAVTCVALNDISIPTYNTAHHHHPSHSTTHVQQQQQHSQHYP